MPVQMIINQAGPLPLKANFDAKGNQVMYLEVNGSAYSGNANRMIGIDIHLDNKSVGKAQIFSNGASTHRAVVPAYLPIQLSQARIPFPSWQAPATQRVTTMTFIPR
jgi:hypothetical protein